MESRNHRGNNGLEDRRVGFTLIELIMVMSILALAMGMAAPRIASSIQHNRVNRAVTLVAADLQSAFSVAGRQRKPVRVSLNTSTKTYTIADRATGATIRSRVLGPTSEYKLASVTFSPPQIEIFPNGVSTAALTVTLSSGDYSRQVTASTSGFVRRVP